MKLDDCELSQRCVRGHNTMFLFGDRPLTGDECAALMAEYLETYGPRQVPAYVSPDGWQLLDAEPAPAPASAPAAPPKQRRK